jgi:hypothetical protein
MFSLPLLYTMEVWWTGFIAAPLRKNSGLDWPFQPASSF